MNRMNGRKGTTFEDVPNKKCCHTIIVSYPLIFNSIIATSAFSITIVLFIGPSSTYNFVKKSTVGMSS